MDTLMVTAGKDVSQRRQEDHQQDGEYTSARSVRLCTAEVERTTQQLFYLN